MKKSNTNFSLKKRDSLSTSPWQRLEEDGEDSLKSEAPGVDQIYDCLIIGAGITGLTTAVLLQRSGLSCIIAEAREPGFGTTGGTTSHLNTFFDATYPEIERDFGEDAAKLIADAGKEAIELIKSFVKELEIDCDLEFKDGLLYAQNEKEDKQLNEIFEASKRAGVQVEKSDDNGVSVPFTSAIRFADQGQFHPLKYIQGLLKEFIALGGILLENTRILEDKFQDGFFLVKAENKQLKARKFVYATHIPPGVNLMSMRNAPYRSYVLGLKLKEDNYPEGLVYDSIEPYHYFRTHQIDGQNILILGGEDHKTGHGDPETAFENLKQYAVEYYPDASVVYQWSAQYYIPVDGLPYIGQQPGAPDHTYMATGFNGNGMTFGTMAAKIISDLILGNENKYADLLSPSRLKPIAGFKEFVKENADVVWHFLADRFAAEELQEFNNLHSGEGKIFKYEGKKVAIYKDETGIITALNSICTHAGCIVHFNSVEKSWDCPCHGGRFDTTGKVLNGPPTVDLKKLVINSDIAQHKP